MYHEFIDDTHSSQNVCTRRVEKIVKLLRENNLPHSDLLDSSVEFHVALSEELLVGCIGMERYSKHALLCSFAVQKAFQGKDLALAY